MSQEDLKAVSYWIDFDRRIETQRNVVFLLLLIRNYCK
jgi:hypothetical protein